MAVREALSAVMRLLMIRISLLGARVLMRTLSPLALHLREQALEKALCGSPLGPWVGMKLVLSLSVMGVFSTKL